jgi:dUTP pyrophosphatase
MEIKIKALVPHAVAPTYATSGSGAFDLYATSMYSQVDYKDPVIVNTGLAFEIPQDHVMLVFSRSGHGFKDDVRLSNCVGVIDSDYRGEVKVKLTRDDNVNHTSPFAVKAGDRIAQAMIIKIDQVTFTWVDELSNTDRDLSGFGSTGV